MKVPNGENESNEASYDIEIEDKPSTFKVGYGKELKLSIQVGYRNEFRDTIKLHTTVYLTASVLRQSQLQVLLDGKMVLIMQISTQSST